MGKKCIGCDEVIQGEVCWIKLRVIQLGFCKNCKATLTVAKNWWKEPVEAKIIEVEIKKSNKILISFKEQDR